MIIKGINLRSSVFMVILFIISLLILLFVFRGLRIMSFLFIIIVFTLSFNLSAMGDFKKKNCHYSKEPKIMGLVIGLLTTLSWLIVNIYSMYLGTRNTISLGVAILAFPLIGFYSLIGFLGGICSGWSQKKLKIHYILRIVSILVLVYFIAFTIKKDQQILNQHNTEGIFCDEFEINFAQDQGSKTMYITLLGDEILKRDCKPRNWENTIKEYPDLKIMDEAITQKNPNKCEEIKNKELELTEDMLFVEPIRGLVYASKDLNCIYDECIYSLALITKDENLCIKLSKEESKEDCYFDMAMLNSNKSLCENVSDKRGHFDFGSFRDLCYTDAEKIEYPKGYFGKWSGRVITGGRLDFFDKLE